MIWLFLKVLELVLSEGTNLCNVTFYIHTYFMYSKCVKGIRQQDKKVSLSTVQYNSVINQSINQIKKLN